MVKTFEELKGELKNAPSQDEKVEVYKEIMNFVITSKSMTNSEKVEKLNEISKFI